MRHTRRISTSRESWTTAGLTASSTSYRWPYQTSCLVSSRECLEEIGMDLEACGTFDGLFSQICRSV